MEQEEKQLLLKDLCARLSYGVIIQEYNEEKANNIATNNLDRCFGNKQIYGATCALEMAAWKEQQMIEKFTKFLETNSHIENNRYLCIDSNKDIRFISEFIEYFKNYMSNE